MDKALDPGLDELRGIYLFSVLDDGQLATVLNTTRVVQLDEGERLFDHGQSSQHYFFLRSGQIKLFRSARDGGEKVIEIVRSGETFAEAVMFMEETRPYPVSAQAIVASELLAFEQSSLLGILEESSATCMRLMAGMSRRLRQQVDEIDRLTLHNATYRLATYLLQQIPRGVMESAELHLTTPKHVVASRLAIQPETFSRILARLAENGCVEVHGNNIVLTDIEAIREIVSE
ncbi:MAG: Crp/Fnr family transcriptional regulator [Gammaproteobacteria bacterium]|nr:Crp/Fnr family transcriptional regulator [Gammaproteobacteria bacterium]